MNRYIGFLILFAVSIVSCKNQGEASTSPNIPSEDSLAKQQFFPVTTYIKGQIYKIKNIPINPLIRTIVNDKVVDSAWLQFGEFDKAFEQFTNPEIDSLSLIKEYLQSSFQDRTIEAMTFTHDRIKPITDTSVYTLKSWNFYIDAKTNLLRKVFMVKEKGSSTLHLTWNNDSNCSQRYIRQKPDGTLEVEKEITINWDF